MPTISITGNADAQPDNDSTFLLYHGASHVTGERLGQYLGVPHGRECDDRFDYLIRWGSRRSVSFRPRREVLNSMSAQENNTDKFAALQQLDSAGVPVPDYTRDRDEIRNTFGYPALGRADDHTRGQDINLIMQWRDAYLTSNNDHFVEYIPTEYEYRMHVIDGEVVKVHEKRLRSEADNHPFIRNHETGWIFMEPRDEPPADQVAIDAVGALGLDFGAVDIIKEEGTGDAYVLEVNTAPSLDEANLERYGDHFADYVGIEPAGMDRVEWDDDEEQENPDEGESDDDDGLGELFG